MQVMPENMVENASGFGFSYITPIGYMPSHSCGYCHGSGNVRHQKSLSTSWFFCLLTRPTGIH
ncbi:hypothetical protein GGS20DRAFT_101590 [Poronia punctata]|nr:hypothetical protein GGS20DRAFT_101590 [Poronia punctata]